MHAYKFEGFVYVILTGMVVLFKKTPPNNISGMRNVGPKAMAIWTEVAMHDIRYPANKYLVDLNKN